MGVSRVRNCPSLQHCRSGKRYVEIRLAQAGRSMDIANIDSPVSNRELEKTVDIGARHDHSHRRDVSCWLSVSARSLHGGRCFLRCQWTRAITASFDESQSGRAIERRRRKTVATTGAVRRNAQFATESCSASLFGVRRRRRQRRADRSFPI